MHRRQFLKTTGAIGGAALLAPDFWREALAGPAVPGRGPYGPLLPPDANGLRLPAGFTSRIIARSQQTVASTGFTWPLAPDGGHCFPDGTGWIYVANSEVENDRGGASAIRFSATGEILNAYSICSGTSRNCSGGITPWRTYLSCEEPFDGLGQVYECDPYRPGQGVVRPLLGTFDHEAAVVDPDTGHVYLTEDSVRGRLYRFVPTVRGDLSRGQLFAASVTNGVVTWVPTSSTVKDRQTSTTAFNGGEGMYMGDRTVFFATKGDQRVWELDLRTNRISVLYDASTADVNTLNDVDAVVVHYPSGDVFVAEDKGNMEIGVIGRVRGERQVAAFLRVENHVGFGSEVTGISFTPDGTRMYFSSQRGTDGNGVTYEVRGPFRVAPSRMMIDRDTYVRGGSKGLTITGTETELQVCANASADFTKVTLLSVDTSTYDPVVARATLRMWARMSSGGPSVVRVHALDDDWAENVRWANRPVPGREVGRFTVQGTTESTVDVDLTAHVVAERAAGRPRISLALVQDVNGPSVVLRSREAGNTAPRLILAPLGFPRVQSVTLPAVRDAHVRGGAANESRNFGTATLLEVRDDTFPENRRSAFVAVDTSAYIRQPTKAQFRIQARTAAGATRVVDVFACSSSWTETGITFLNQPARGTKIGSFTVTGGTFRPYVVDVSSYVAARRTAGARTISFAFATSGNGPLVEMVATDSRTNPPRLTLS